MSVSRLTEECIESSNKVYLCTIWRNVCHATAQSTMMTLMRHVLVSTDPVVASLYSIPRKVKTPIPAFAKKLFPSVAPETDDDDLELWYNDDMQGRFHQRLHGARAASL